MHSLLWINGFLKDFKTTKIAQYFIKIGEELLKRVEG